MRPLSSAVLALSTLALTACDPPEEGSVPTLRSLSFTHCGQQNCGRNAHVAGAISINHLSSDSINGYRFIGAMTPEGQPADVVFRGDELTLVTGDDVELRGPQLVGLRFVLLGDAGEEVHLHLDGLHGAGVPSLKIAGLQYRTYRFSMTVDGSPPRPLCEQTPWNDHGSTAGLGSRDALVIPREGYAWDGDPLIPPHVPDGEGDAWFTIGCAGGAYAKKVLLGYDPTLPRTHEAATSVGENEAMMRMLTAQYCREGSHFTMTGTPLFWENQQGWFEPPSGLQVEAIWSPNGAVCHNEPRLVYPQLVFDECGYIPPCAGIDPTEYPLVSYTVGETSTEENWPIPEAFTGPL